MFCFSICLIFQIAPDLRTWCRVGYGDGAFQYFEYLFVKNPDIDQIKELVEEQIFNVDEITEVNDVSIEIDSLKRSAVIRYEAVTDEKTYKEEVKIGG